MRREQRSPRKWEKRLRLRRLAVTSPLFLLIGFSFFVRSADSSSTFPRNHDGVLERLKNRIEQSKSHTRDELSAQFPELRKVHEVVQKGDTFNGILTRVEGLNTEDFLFWSLAGQTYPELVRLHPDHSLTFLVDDTGQIAGLQYETSPSERLVLRRENDEVRGGVEQLPTRTELQVVSGRIETSLYQAAVDKGVPDSVVSGFVDIFGWDINFSRDLRRGDQFRVAYEVIHDSRGRALRSGRVLAAELETSHRSLQAVYFESSDEAGSYYDYDGASLGRGFLRYPVEFTRISSQFNCSRFHPVLGVRRPHLGIDFAAPVGTPIRSIGAGLVKEAGWNGGNGRFIKIEHQSRLASSYSHLRRIAPGIRPGVRVARGQIIGTVGASGLATGPHLHFAMYRNGVYVNPMEVRPPSSPSLTAKLILDFERTRDDLLNQLNMASADASDLERVASLGSGS